VRRGSAARPCADPPVPPFFGAPEGWAYTLTLRGSDGTALFHVEESREDTPKKDGPHHGKTFDAARLVVDVDEKGVLTIPKQDVDLDLWKRG